MKHEIHHAQEAAKKAAAINNIAQSKADAARKKAAKA